MRLSNTYTDTLIIIKTLTSVISFILAIGFTIFAPTEIAAIITCWGIAIITDIQLFHNDFRESINCYIRKQGE